MTESIQEKVAAIVVTYNRKNLLGECLNSLLNQTFPFNAIYIIDNSSTDGTPEFLIEKGFIDRPLYPDKAPLENVKIIQPSTFPDKIIEIRYIRMHENTGGAGGFHEGVKRAYMAGFDWIWLMDDDVAPKEDCLENLIYAGKSDTKILVVSPVKLSKAGFLGGATTYHNYRNPFSRKRKYFRIYLKSTSMEEIARVLENMPDRIEVCDVPFEGPLIKRDAVQKAGLPNKDLFIYGDDAEYCMRIKKYGLIILSTRAIIIRKLPPPPPFHLVSKIGRFCFRRNHSYIDMIHGENVLVRKLRPLLYLIGQTIQALSKLDIKEAIDISKAYRGALRLSKLRNKYNNINYL